MGRGSWARRVSWALANTTASTLRIASSGGACESPGKAHIHESGGKLNYRGGGTTVSGVPCLGTGAANHEGELVILLPEALAGLDEFAWAAAGDARNTWMAMAECVWTQQTVFTMDQMVHTADVDGPNHRHDQNPEDVVITF